MCNSLTNCDPELECHDSGEPGTASFESSLAPGRFGEKIEAVHRFCGMRCVVDSPA
jgi:hypothetical protein